MGSSSDQLPWLNTDASTREGASQLSQSALGLMRVTRVGGEKYTQPTRVRIPPTFNPVTSVNNPEGGVPSERLLMKRRGGTCPRIGSSQERTVHGMAAVDALCAFLTILRRDCASVVVPVEPDYVSAIGGGEGMMWVVCKKGGSVRPNGFGECAGRGTRFRR